MERTSNRGRTDAQLTTDADATGVTRRRVLAGLGASAVAVGLAGCGDGSAGDGSGDGGGGSSGGDGGSSGGGSGGDGSSDGDDGSGEDGGDSGLGDPDGEVTETADGLAIVGLESYTAEDSMLASDGAWAADVTIENTGDRETSVMDYDFEVALYDDDGSEIDSRISYGTTGGSDVSPGQTTTITVADGSEVDPATVARYEIAIVCGMFGDGAYCD